MINDPHSSPKSILTRDKTRLNFSSRKLSLDLRRALQSPIFIALIIFLSLATVVGSERATAGTNFLEKKSFLMESGFDFFENLTSPSATFTVNSAADTNDGACTTSANGCTLREAIIAANNRAGTDSIIINLGGASPTINVGSGGLPAITDPVSIVGQGASGQIQINGAGAGTGAAGFRIIAGNSIIRDLVINRFDGPGILLETGGSNNILNCLIGLNAAQTTALGNRTGIVILNSPDNLIGGSNVISGNLGDGILIDGTGSINNEVRYNFIGTNGSGNIAIGNGLNGVAIRNASNNRIGLPLPPLGGFSPANVISGNTTNGVAITGSSATGNIVQGNVIGLNTTGSADLGNGGNGVYILNGANNNAVGKRDVDFGYWGNAISGNGGDGVRIDGTGTNANVLGKNVIGLGAGEAAFGNGGNGVYILNGASNNFVGDPSWGQGNVIAASIDGIRIEGATTTGNKVTDNIIGLNSTQTEPRPNNFNGVVILNAPNNTIGRFTTFGNPVNVIGGNGANGVAISGSAATGNLILNNRIGGAGNLGNGAHGIRVTNNAANNTIGGEPSLETNNANLITGNGGDGILIESGTGNHLTINSISNNAGLGIDLSPDGVTANDTGDADTGVNNLQNFPVLNSALKDGSATRITGSLNSLANTALTVRFFNNNACDSSGHGEGMTYLGALQITTDGGGNADFSTSFSNINLGQAITATATDPGSNTSEFSQCRIVVPDTAGTIQFGASSYLVNENGTSLAINVTRTGGTLGGVTVQYATANGTAVAGQDYTAVAGTLNFASGETNKSFNIPIINDDTDEPNETFTISLSNPTGGATIGNPGAAVVTITDNDNQPSLSVSDVSVTEGSSGTTNANFVVSLSASSGHPVTVNYATANGTAIAGQDYTAVAGNLSFAPGELTKTVSVPVTGDALVEPNENFTLSLSGAVNATISDAQAVGTIINDDTGGSIQFSSAVFTVNENGGSALLTVTRSNGNAAVSVNYATANGTAVAGQDYTAVAGTLNFGAGETSKTFSVSITGDALDEADETINLSLSNPTGGATLGGTSSAILTILDDDLPPAISIGDLSLNEGNSGITNAVLTVSLSAASGRVVTVNWATSNGTAVAPGDYTAGSGTLTFNAGETTRQIVVAVNGDLMRENNENFLVNLTIPANATISDAQASGLILNDDLDNAQFVSQSVPSTMTAGLTYQVAVTMRNTGTISWFPGVYFLASQNPPETMRWGINRVPLPSVVAPGASVTFNFNVTAPTAPGIYNFQWQMLHDSFPEQFGAPSANLAINVTTAGSDAFCDFDGDRKTDISIFRPGAGEWWYLRSSDGTSGALQFGSGSDKLTPADFTGDGRTDIAVFRPATGFWFVLRSEDNSFFSFPFGTSGDIAAPADYDGDGRADAAVFRPSSATWYILRSSGGGTIIQQFGAPGDVPVAADYDGDRKADMAVFRPLDGSWWILKSSNGTTLSIAFGTGTDKPVAADYTGDGRTDIAVWRPSTGFWYILRSEDGSFFSFPFGTSGDVAAPGDYDGDGRADAAVFRPSNATWFINRSSAGVLIVAFGTSGDIPVPGAFVP